MNRKMNLKGGRMSAPLGLAFVLGLILALSMELSRSPQPVRADGGMFYVDDDTCPAPGSGTLGDPYCRIQDAVDMANPGDEIRVAAGTYTGAQTVLDSRSGYTYTQVVFITESLTLRGGYDAANWSAAPDPAANPTVIDAEGYGRDISIVGEDVYSETLLVTVDSVTLTGGDYTGLGNPAGASERVCHRLGADCGGGLLAYRCRLTLLNSVIAGNVASRNQGDGGGLYIWKVMGAPGIRIENTTIISNSAESGSGIYVAEPWGSPLALARSTLQSNTASGVLGSLVLDRVFGPVTITETNFISNTAPDGDGDARIELGTHGSLWMDRIRFQGNQIKRYAVLNLYGRSGAPTARLTNMLFAGNHLANVETAEGIVHLLSTADAFELSLAHVTAADNEAPTFLYLHNAFSDKSITATLTNTLVSGVASAFAGDEYESGTGNVVIQHAHTLLHNVMTPHLTVAGTPTFVASHTLTGDPKLDGTYHLQTGSAAIDAGVEAGVTTDLDGDPRPSGLAPDIGSDEAIRYLIYLPVVLK